MSVESLQDLLPKCALVVVSHYSAIRAELNRERPYTAADKDERLLILLSLKDSLDAVITDASNLSEVQYAAAAEIYNEVLGLIRALGVAREHRTRDSFDKLATDRDLCSLRLDNIVTIFNQEESAELETIPGYFIES